MGLNNDQHWNIKQKPLTLNQHEVQTGICVILNNHNAEYGCHKPHTV